MTTNPYLFSAVLTTMTQIVLAICVWLYTRRNRDATTDNEDVDSIAKVNKALGDEVTRLNGRVTELERNERECRSENKRLSEKIDELYRRLYATQPEARP